MCLFYFFYIHKRTADSVSTRKPAEILPTNYPTEPSRLMASNFWASTANSIGSLLSTSLA